MIAIYPACYFVANIYCCILLYSAVMKYQQTREQWDYGVIYFWIMGMDFIYNFFYRCISINPIWYTYDIYMQIDLFALIVAVSCQHCVTCRESGIRHCFVFRDPLWLITDISIIYPPTKVLLYCSRQMNHPGNRQLYIKQKDASFHENHKMTFVRLPCSPYYCNRTNHPGNM